MSHGINQQISNLFRLVESDLGAKNMSTLVLQAFIQTVQNFKTDNPKVFMKQFNELIDIIESIQPRFATIIDDFYDIWELLNSNNGHSHPWAWYKHKVEKHIDNILKKNDQDFKNLLKHGDTCINNGDVILIHSHSRTVLDVLKFAHNHGRLFQVIVAEQDMDKTHDNIEYLSINNIPFQVIPSYMLAHIEDRVTKLFFGAVTLKNTKDFVMNAGSKALISEFYLKKIPCYMFITTQKFSLWESSPKASEVHTVINTKKHVNKSINFERLKFSHDRVPLEYFSQIITESGIFNSQETFILYEKLFKERMSHEKIRGERHVNEILNY